MHKTTAAFGMPQRKVLFMTSRDETGREACRDYFLVKWEEDRLTMEPFCCRGHALDEDYFCPECGRQCQITFFLCRDSMTLSVVQRFIRGNPSFRNFEADLSDR
ncbi:MAG: hypothetical protein KBH99_10350 [Syntrophobacteraceae bacterium]|nr:hypothetical protein [Syntrophobacteraceae bacterium]